jgi:predicted ABC-type ATPase
VAPTPCIFVLAGNNGAGKSSLGGATIRARGADYFNPDEAALRIRAVNPGMTAEQANAAAWHEGKRLLERAIAERLSFAFETTLGGRTMASLLDDATTAGVEVRVWYVGVESPELCIKRVRARVAAGGHAIPEAMIRERYHKSLLNLLRLMPRISELRVFDNSTEAAPAAGRRPQPVLVLHMRQGRAVETCELAHAPAWAKPILAAAIRMSESSARRA